MIFCPNINHPDWKKLVKTSKTPYSDWHDSLGNIGGEVETSPTINQEKAMSFLKKLFPGEEPVFYEFAKEIGNKTIHGIVEDGVIKLWKQAESGTEYHEAYHKVFRLMLSEQQRTNLYKDAEKQFGKPTAEELKNLKDLFPDLTDSDLYNLGLEERMAEGFREYMQSEEEPKGLIASIAKWFKDLFTWMKALVSNNLAIKDIYSLMGSTKVNQSLFGRKILRNPEKITSDINPTFYRPGISSDLTEAIVTGLTNKIVDVLSSKKDLNDINILLGKGNNKGIIIDSLLTKLYGFTDNRNIGPKEIAVLNNIFKLHKNIILNEEAFAKTGNAEYNKKADEAAKLFKEARKEAGVALINFPAINPETMSLREREKAMAARKTFRLIFDVIDNWFGKIEPVTKNTIVPAWRDAVEKELGNYGYKIKQNKFEEIESEVNVEDQSLESLDGVEDKIYDKIHFLESLDKRLSQMARTLLRRIPILEEYEVNGTIVNKKVPNKVFSDQPTYFNVEYVYKQLSELWADAKSFTEMQTRLRNFAKYRPDYKAIYAQILKLNAAEKLTLYRSFASTITDFTIVVTGTKSKLFNSNTNTTSNKAKQSWKTQSIEIGGIDIVEKESDRALYIKSELDETDQFKVKTDRLNNIKDAITQVHKYVTSREKLVYISDTPTAQTIALAHLLWNLGMNLGDNTDIQDTINNLQSLLNTGVSFIERNKLKEFKGEELYKKIYTNGNLFSIVKSLVTTTITNNKLQFGDAVSNPTPYFDLENSGVTFLAELTPFFTNRTSQSFVNIDNNLAHPVNLKTPIDDLVTDAIVDVTKNKDKAFENSHKQDVFHINSLTGASHLFNHLLNNPKFLKAFKTVTTDGIKPLDEEGQGFGDFNEADHILTRLYHFINNNNKEFYYAVIPSQADRERMMFMLMPRIFGHEGPELNYSTSTRGGKAVKSYAKVFRKAILEDLLRINAAKKVIADPNAAKIKGYHTGDMRGISSDYMQFDGDTLEGTKIVQDFLLKATGQKLYMSDLVENYIQSVTSGSQLIGELKEFENKLVEMITNLTDFYERSAENLAKTIIDSNRFNEVDPKFIKEWSASGKSTKKDLVDLMFDFVIHEDLGRNEIVKFTRGNRALYKTNEDFTKRMRLLTTPGEVLGMKGDVGFLEGITEEYGMRPIFTDFTFLDPRGDLTSAILNQTKDWVTRNIEKLRALGHTDKEIASIYGYNPGEFEETDGLGLISIDLYRDIEQGRGQWFQEHEEAYKAYKVTGEFVFQKNFVPKGFKEGDAVPIVPYKPYVEDLELVSGVITTETEKTAWVPLLKSYTKDKPVMNDIRHRMELNPSETDNPYIGKGLKKLDVAHALSVKKTKVVDVFDFKANSQVVEVLDENGNVIETKNEYRLGSLDTIKVAEHRSKAIRFPQTLSAKKDSNPEVTLNRQLKKNAIANVKDLAVYFMNAGLYNSAGQPIQTMMLGKNLKDLYHTALEEKLNRDFQKVETKLGLTKFKSVVESIKNSIEGNSKSKLNSILATKEYQDAKLELLQNIRKYMEQYAYDRELVDSYIEALNITIDPVTLIPRFTIPLDLPIYGRKYQSAIFSLFNNSVFKQKTSGYEAVQTGMIGGFDTDDTLKFLEIEEHKDVPEEAKQFNYKGYRLVHAEIALRPDIIRKLGLKEGDSLESIPEELRRIIGYRIPNQDKSSMVIFKIARALPSNYEKAITVPPQLVKLMGSDFDVDKMFLLFPKTKFNKETKTYEKVIPDYNTIFRDLSKVKTLADDELDNIILDSFEAVLSSENHIIESISPLDSNILKEYKQELSSLIPGLASKNQWTGGVYETQSAIRNLLGNKLRGLWANALAGRNVASSLVDFNVADEYAVKITGTEVNHKFLTKTPVITNLNGEETADSEIYTDKIISRYLSAAVDAAKDPFQYIINDNIITFPVELMWINFNGDTKLLHYFLNQPIIREFVNIMSNKYGNDLSKVYLAYEATAKKFEITTGSEQVLPKSYKAIKKTLAMSPQSILDFKVQPAVALNNFMKLYVGGRQLKELFKVITPDTMDGINRMEALESYLDRKDKFANPFNGFIDGAPVAFYGKTKNDSILNQVLTEDSQYGYQKAYYDLILKTFTSASAIFPIQTSPEFLKFKEAIKNMVNKTTFSSEQHRDVNAGILFTLLTRMDSPIRPYLDKAYSDANYKPSKTGTTLLAKISKLKKKYPGLKNNEFLSKHSENTENTTFTKDGFKTFGFNNSEPYSPEEKNRIKSDIENLLYRPEAYLPKEILKDPKAKAEAQQEIRKFTYQLLLHPFIVNGFKNSYASIDSLIPPKFFLEKFDRSGQKLDPISIAEYLHQQSAKINNGNYFTTDDLIRFFRMFGEMRPGGQNLVDRYTTEFTLAPVETVSYSGDIDNLAKIKVFRSSLNQESEVYLLDEEATLKSSKTKAVYLSLYKTSNNKKHIVGGRSLDSVKIGKGQSIEDYKGLFNLYLQTAQPRETTPDDYVQLCRLS